MKIPKEHTEVISLTEDTELVSQDTEASPTDASGNPAFSISASIIVGAILISASIFFNTNVLVTKLSLPAAARVDANTGAAAPQQAAGPVTITLKPNTPFLGKSDAKVTVVEFADYQCPFCEKFFTAIMPDLKAKYIDTGKVKFVYQDAAILGADSITAAEASHCAQDQNKFWEYHDYLFSHQGQENSGWATAAHQKEFAKALGLNMADFNKCLDGHKYLAEVQAESSAANNYGVNGTPTSFVNGQIIKGAVPVSQFEQSVDAALQK